MPEEFVTCSRCRIEIPIDDPSYIEWEVVDGAEFCGGCQTAQDAARIDRDYLEDYMFEEPDDA